MRAVCLLVLLLALTGCDEAEFNGVESGASTDSSDSIPDYSVGSMHEQVLALTNSHRAANGRAALVANAQLSQAAQAFAELMGRENFFSHTSPDGTSAGERIAQTGYDYRTWGENIAYGQKTAAAVMNGWMNSSGHRSNILNSGFKEIGIGYYLDESNTAYWVQDFGAQ